MPGKKKKKKKEEEEGRRKMINKLKCSSLVFSTLLKVSRTNRVDLALE